MSADIYHNIKKLCSDVISRKETLRFVSQTMTIFDQNFVSWWSTLRQQANSFWNCSNLSCIENRSTSEVFSKKSILRNSFLPGLQFTLSDSTNLEQDFECRLPLRPPATILPFTTWSCSGPHTISIYCVRRSGVPSKFTLYPNCSAESTMICGQKNNINPSCLAGLIMICGQINTIINPCCVAGMTMICGHINTSCVAGMTMICDHNTILNPSFVAGRRLIHDTIINPSCIAEDVSMIHDTLNKHLKSLVLGKQIIIAQKISDVVVNTTASVSCLELNCSNEMSKDFAHVSSESFIRKTGRTLCRDNKNKRREREPSRLCVKKLCKIFRCKHLRKKLRQAIRSGVPKSSILYKMFLTNYKTYSLKYMWNTHTFFCKYVFFLNNRRKKTHSIVKGPSRHIYYLRGGMFLGNSLNNNSPWNILVNKLALIDRVPFDCGSSSGDCFFASVAHALYGKPELHFEIRSAGITHMINNPELYIESLSNMPWQHYIHEMSKSGTWCDNLIIQGVCNALNCRIRITDSNPNVMNETIISPVHFQQRPQTVFLGYINGLHYMSTLPVNTGYQNVNTINLLKQTVSVNEKESSDHEKLEKQKNPEKPCKVNEKSDAKSIWLAKRRKLEKSNRVNENSNAKSIRLVKRRELAKLYSANETSDAKSTRLAKRREREKSHRASENNDAKNDRLAKRREAYRSKITTEKSKTVAHANSNNKTVYLYNFDVLKNGMLHDQFWAKHNMKQFHESIQFEIFQCTICKEAWPLNTKPKAPMSYKCLRCSRDKDTPKRFSEGNYMIPGPVPTELQGLTQAEEMLIARALPIMRIYIKPGGQRGYSGHCINLPQNVNDLASNLPRYPKDLAIIVVKVKGKDNTFKDISVRRHKVHDALVWLVRNNPHYKDVIINHHALNCLPVDGVPSAIVTVESHKDIVSDELESDLEPSTSIDEEDKVYDHSSDMSSFMPVNQQQQQELSAIKDQLQPRQSMNWPKIDKQPLNEYDTPFLATLAFPTLFPDGKGDPTNLSLLKDIPLGEKVKHLIKFAENVNGKWIYRFASHPRFAYWALNMIQRKRVLQQSAIFLKQNPGEAHLTVDELRELAASNNSNTFLSKISRYVANIVGSDAYWFKVREDLKAIVTTVGTPTLFFTFSSADMHWPELHALLGNENSTSDERRQAVINNPHIVDWFFTQRLESFIKHWLYNTLDAKWHWYRFEYQARGSIHCHGTAKLNNDPGLCNLTKTALKGFLAQKYKSEHQDEDTSELDQDTINGKEAANTVCKYVDWLLSTINPNPPDDGMWIKPDCHPCHKRYEDIPEVDVHDDYCDLLNMVQRHTRCSTSYCLRKKSTDSEPTCRFKFPMSVCPKTELQFEQIHTKDGEPHYRAKVVTKRNDTRINNHQQLQLQGWRANCDIQVVIDHYACVEYLTKYAAKGEPRSHMVKEAFNKIMNYAETNSDPHRAIKQIIMKTLGERDYAAQETMHHLLSLKLYSSSFNVIPVSLNGSRKIQVHSSNAEGICSNPSLLDVYANREKYNSPVDTAKLNFVQFATQFKGVNNKLTRLADNVVPKIFPTYSSNPRGPNFGQYCKYQLLRYKPWKTKEKNAWDDEDETDDIMISKWQQFLQTPYAESNVPDWFDKLQSVIQNLQNPDDQPITTQPVNTQEEWMIISDLHAPFSDSPQTNTESCYNWQNDRSLYSEQQIGEMPTWIRNMREQTNQTLQQNYQNVDLNTFSEMQRLAYNVVRAHFEDPSPDKEPLALIINGVAGTGKSYLINAIRTLLQGKCAVTATTGKAAFNINGITIHSLLKLPVGTRGNKDLTGQALVRLQESLSDIDYIIIDEYSMIGQISFGWVDRRCKQASGYHDKLLGNKSIILCGDPAQLPPVADKPLYHTIPTNTVGEQGYLTYKMFDKVVKLSVNQRVQGSNPGQTQFRELLLRLRKGESTLDDWKLLLTRQPASVENLAEFNNAIRLFYSNEEVGNYNHDQLIKLQQPVAQIRARHSSAAAQKISPDDFSGLQPLLFLAKGAKIMLTMNLWPAVGLCNGATGTIVDFIYNHNNQPPDLPIAVVIKFDNYTGPSISHSVPSCVPICPITALAQVSDGTHERQQLPLKLAWAITIHKSQGLTLPKTWVNIGKSEKTAGVSYVALSRVKSLVSSVIEPMTYQRLTSLKSSKTMQYRLHEENRLAQLAQTTYSTFYEANN